MIVVFFGWNDRQERDATCKTRTQCFPGCPPVRENELPTRRQVPGEATAEKPAEVISGRKHQTARHSVKSRRWVGKQGRWWKGGWPRVQRAKAWRRGATVCATGFDSFSNLFMFMIYWDSGACKKMNGISDGIIRINCRDGDGDVMRIWDFSWDITSNICGFNKPTWLYNGCGIICHMRFSVLMELNGDRMRIQDETSWDLPIYGI